MGRPSGAPAPPYRSSLHRTPRKTLEPARHLAAGRPVTASARLAAFLVAGRPSSQILGTCLSVAPSACTALGATAPGRDPAALPRRVAPLQAGGSHPPPSLHPDTWLSLI
ncbi:hypothetical protein ZWY2020_000109 [Hordeum vulgare]|nr:hypothetical protein ZWY2020_000109 [Hordeum vulgare]